MFWPSSFLPRSKRRGREEFAAGSSWRRAAVIHRSSAVIGAKEAGAIHVVQNAPERGLGEGHKVEELWSWSEKASRPMHVPPAGMIRSDKVTRQASDALMSWQAVQWGWR